MGQGIAAIFVAWVGCPRAPPGTSGLGVPQITAIMDVASARDDYIADTGRYVPVVADGGKRRGGELARRSRRAQTRSCSPPHSARAEEAPGRGTNWGMAGPLADAAACNTHKVGTVGPLERILFRTLACH